MTKREIFFVEFFHETLHKNTIALYSLYFERHDASWAETVIDSSRYPTTAKIRSRSKDQIKLEADMKRFLLASSIPQESITAGSIWESILLKFEETKDHDAIRRSIMGSPFHVVPLSERIKIDIEILPKDKAKLLSNDAPRLAADLICLLDLPFSDFMQFPELSDKQIIHKVLDFLTRVETEYNQLQFTSLKRSTT